MESKTSISKGARFGCGFVFGFLFVFGFTTGSATGGDGFGGAILLVGVALLFGFAAAIFGDKFWRWAEKWLG